MLPLFEKAVYISDEFVTEAAAVASAAAGVALCCSVLQSGAFRFSVLPCIFLMDSLQKQRRRLLLQVCCSAL